MARTLFVHEAPYGRHCATGLCYGRGMATPDLNLLLTLDVLLAEQSVARAADKLGLSPSAMSRALARLREATGDPLLVQVGRGLVPTPHAVALRERVSRLVEDGVAVLRPVDNLDLGRLVRSFTLGTGEGFVDNFGPNLLARIALDAPGVRLRFLHRSDKDSAALLDGSADLETGVVGKATASQVHAQALFRDRLVGVVRSAHPLCRATITPAAYAAAGHISVARRGGDRGVMSAIDEALGVLGLERRFATTVSGFGSALALARACDLIATVPERHTGTMRAGMVSFALPVATPEVTVSMLWHPRLHADAAHRWLRGCVRDACAAPEG